MSKDVVSALQDKVEKYEELLDNILAEKKTFGTVIGGPEIQGKKKFYRITDGHHESMAAFTETIMFEKVKTLEIGDEVILVNSQIIGVVPKKLKSIETPPTFNLIGWDEIGGLKSQLQDIRDAIELPLQNEELAKQLGLSPVKGILLYGPPGCGKTLVGKAIASTVLNEKVVDARAFIYVKGGELLSRYIGATEERIANMFKSCRDYTKDTGKRSIIFIDEAEAIMPRRGSGKSSDVEKTIVPTFLAEMDGIEGNNPLILLSTNLPESIDSAILREGRIDIKVEIKRPNITDVEEIFNIHLAKVKCAEDITALAAEGTKCVATKPCFGNISGSMIEVIVKLSIQKAMKRKIADKSSALGVITKDIDDAVCMIK